MTRKPLHSMECTSCHRLCGVVKESFNFTKQAKTQTTWRLSKHATERNGKIECDMSRAVVDYQPVATAA